MIELFQYVREQGARRKGLEAGYHGNKRECPYIDLNLGRQWLAGYAEGADNRRYDLACGTHPELDLQPRHKRKMA